MVSRKSVLTPFKLSERQYCVIFGLFIMVVLYIKFIRPRLESFSITPSMGGINAAKSRFNVNATRATEAVTDNISKLTSKLKHKFK